MTFCKRTLLVAFSILIAVSGFISLNIDAEALSGSEFKPGNIISDSIFYRGNTMSTTQIKTFLKSKVPTCDTNHSKTSNPNDSGPPYTCLKDFVQNTPNRAADNYCKAYPGGYYTAARIIYEVGKACNVSQKALLVLLQKEQALVTDTWPWDYQYKFATGFCVYDSGTPPPSCSGTSGFFNQVYYAARQFQRYRLQPSSFSFRKGRTSNIQYHPNTGCGTKKVSIVNSATAGLYNYTPYTPNTASLNNLYGTGNSCSSYGNRNFWRMYRDWFGSTHPVCTSSDSAGQYVYRLFSTKRANHFYTAMECEAYMFDAKTSYSIEGTTLEQAPQGENGRTGVYRLKRKSSRTYFWTSSVKERDNLARYHNYIYEGTAFIGYTKDSTAPNKAPVYRLYNSSTGGHLWTPSANERDNVASKPSWRYEGVAYYAHKP